MHFSSSALIHALSIISAALVAPSLAAPAAASLAQRDQVYVAGPSIQISAPVSNAPNIKLVSSDSGRANPKLTLALGRAARVTTTTSTSFSYTTQTTTSTKSVGTSTTTGTTTTVALTVSTSTSLTTQTTASTKSVGTTTTTSTTTTKAVTSTTTKPAPTSSSTSSKMTSSSTTSKAAASSASATHKPINAVYFPDWTAAQVPPESVDYSLFDIVYFAFALPAQDMSLYFTQWNSIDILQRLIKAGHAAGSKVAITIGGWTGSQYFSTAVSTAANRETFAQNIADMVTLYGADGIDIDWEYPGQSGNEGNIVAGSDSANLLIFLGLLRSKLGSSAIISLATPLNVWYGSNGQPMTDVSKFAQYIDHVLLMNYDVWGASANPGPNAPMNYCGNSWQPGSNAINAVKNWKAAGMPANKIMLGVPSYGYVSDSGATTLIHKRSRQMEAMEARRIAGVARSNMLSGNTRPKLSQDVSRRSELETRQSSTAAGDLSSFKGSQIEFNQLISYKAISKSSTGVYYGKNGFTRKWDDCSSTPFLYDTASNTVVTYDDPASLKIKGAFAAAEGLRGTGMWDISGDTATWDLVKATRAGLGI